MDGSKAQKRLKPTVQSWSDAFTFEISTVNSPLYNDKGVCVEIIEFLPFSPGSPACLIDLNTPDAPTIE